MRFPTSTLTLAIVLAAGFMAGPASAGEFRAEADLEHVGMRPVEPPGGGVKKLLHGAMTGRVSSETTPQLAGAIDQKSWTAVIPASGTPKLVGHEAMRTADGSVLTLRFEGVPSAATEDGKGRGTWEVLAGTGAFEGASGHGDYVYIANESGGVKIFEGELTREATAAATE